MIWWKDSNSLYRKSSTETHEKVYKSYQPEYTNNQSVNRSSMTDDESHFAWLGAVKLMTHHQREL